MTLELASLLSGYLYPDDAATFLLNTHFEARRISFLFVCVFGIRTTAGPRGLHRKVRDI